MEIVTGSCVTLKSEEDQRRNPPHTECEEKIVRRFYTKKYEIKEVTKHGLSTRPKVSELFNERSLLRSPDKRVASEAVANRREVSRQKL